MQRICAQLLLFVFTAVTAFGQVELSFNSSSVTSAGQDVEIDIVVEDGFDEIVSMQFSLNWDASVFAYSSISNVTDVLPMFSEPNNLGTPVSAAAVVDGQLTVSWSQTSTQPASIPDGTRLFTLILSSVGPVCQGTSVEISNTPRIIEVVNNDFDILDLTASGGDLSIDDGNCDGMMTMDGVGLSIDDLSAPAGGQLCVPITATGFTDVESIQLGIEWDPNVLSFDAENGVRGVGIFPININANRVDQGQLNALWFFDTAPVTVADGSVLFEVCFDVIGGTGESTMISIVDFSNASPPFEIEISSNNTFLDFFTNDAIFTVGSGDTGGDRNGVGFIVESVFTGDATSICIPILTENFDSLVAFMTGVSFDPSVLRFTGSNTTGLNNVQVASQNADNGELRVLWTDQNANPITLPDGSSLLELCFDIIGAPGTSSPIGFVNIPPNFTIEAIKFPSDPTPFFINDGLINIGNEPTTDGNVVLTASNNTFSGLNDEVCVQFTAENFTNIAGMSFVIGWDQNVLDYIEPRNTNLSGLSTGGSNFVFVEPNSLRVLYTPTSAQSVADGTVIFEVCYRALADCDSGAASDITLGSDGNISVEFIDGNSQVLPVTLNDGRVSAASCSMMQDDQVTLTASNEVINIDQTVCVDFNVDGFNNITEMNFGIDWDDSVLQFLEVRGVNVPGLSAGEPNFVFDSPDGLRVSYTSNSPLSLANNTRIFEVCYNVIDCNQGGTTQIAVGSNSGANLRFVNSSGSVLPVATNNGTLTGNNCDRTAETIALRASSETLNIGELLCVDFAVDNYVNITDMSFVMSWNESILQFSQIRNPNIPGLTGMEPDFTLADAGALRVTYSSASPQTLADNTIIFEACFNVLDCTSGVSSAINIGADNTVPLQFTRSNGSSVPVAVTDALLTGGTCEGDAARIDVVSLTDPSCPGGSDGSLLVDIVNLTGSLSCAWVDENGDLVTNNCNLLGQMAGSYTLTVTDELNASVTETFTLIDPSAIDILSVDTICFSSGNNDGEIEINFTGGAGGYSIIQTDVGDIDGTSIFNLGRGVVTFTAQDAQGCESTFSFTFDGCQDGGGGSSPTDITACDVVSTVISPNGDGTNENFIIGCLNDAANASIVNDLAVYNRWGELVFSADNYDNSWRGTDMNGDELDEGGYMYVFVIGPPTQRQIFRGSITLLR